MADNASSMIGLTGLWLNTKGEKGLSRDAEDVIRFFEEGHLFMSGSIGNAKVLIFVNQKREKDTDPHFRLCVAPKDEQRKDGDRGSYRGSKRRERADRPPPRSREIEDEPPRRDESDGEPSADLPF